MAALARRHAGQRQTVSPCRRYLCGGQLTNSVPQPDTDRRLDAQGDTIMARARLHRVRVRRVRIVPAFGVIAVISTQPPAAGARTIQLASREGADAPWACPDETAWR